MEKWKVFGHLSKMPPVSCSCPPCPWCPFPWSTQAAAPSPALCRGHCLGGKEILEKLMWVILIPFPAGKQRLGAVPKLGTPFFSQLSPRLSQDSSTVSGSHNVLDQTRRLLHSTGSSQSGMSGVRWTNPPCCRYPQIWASSATSKACSAQESPCWGELRDATEFVSLQRVLSLFAQTIPGFVVLLKGRAPTGGCSSRTGCLVPVLLRELG